MPPSYFPETMPQASGDQVMAPTPGDKAEQGDDTAASSSPRGRDGWPHSAPLGLRALCFKALRKPTGIPTYLVEELRELHLHLFPLEHVVLGLLTDRRDQVELPGHRVRLLQEEPGPSVPRRSPRAPC